MVTLNVVKQDKAEYGPYCLSVKVVRNGINPQVTDSERLCEKDRDAELQV